MLHMYQHQGLLQGRERGGANSLPSEILCNLKVPTEDSVAETAVGHNTYTQNLFLGLKNRVIINIVKSNFFNFS